MKHLYIYYCINGNTISSLEWYRTESAAKDVVKLRRNQGRNAFYIKVPIDNTPIKVTKKQREENERVKLFWDSWGV